ncbi:MAG: transglycosylase SLT domain-containing protein [Actinomycetota bacterium]
MRMRRPVALVVLAATLASCVVSEAVTRDLAPAGPSGTTGSPGPSPAPEPPDLPDPDEPVPAAGAAIARTLEATFAANRSAIEAWLEDGDPGAWPPPKSVVLLTLYEQRIVRVLAHRERLGRRVLDRLSGATARETAANVRAGHALFEHSAPVQEVPDFRIRHPEPADALLGYFREAEDAFGVAWEVLAAIMLVETRMGRIRSRSSAGAQGPMQFLPATWDAYGLGGDVHDPHDAVLGAANYLVASGAPADYRRALYAYNPVNAYVTAVWRYARTMRRSPASYYAYFNWQVFVRTVDGDVRMSGPGL